MCGNLVLNLVKSKAESSHPRLARKAVKHDCHILHDTSKNKVPTCRLKSHQPYNREAQDMLSVLSCIVLCKANTPMESNSQGWAHGLVKSKCDKANLLLSDWARSCVVIISGGLEAGV